MSRFITQYKIPFNDLKWIDAMDFNDEERAKDYCRGLWRGGATAVRVKKVTEEVIFEQEKEHA